MCLEKYSNFKHNPGVTYCNPTYDGYLCWPPTPAGATSSQRCPPARLSDTNSYAIRTCGEEGLWLGRRPNESSALGWTNYMPCFPPEVQTLLLQVYDEDERNAQSKFEIAQRTRYMETVGFTISLFALLVSLFIFSYYRSLRNSRTRIHKSLFTAMVVQVVIRLILYIDQELIRNQIGDQSPYDNNVTLWGIDNMPYLCEASYALLEYAITVMFMWMFIEGLYLHNLVTANALRERISHLVYYATGWGLPLILTLAWATMTALHYEHEDVKKCWYGYNFSPLYWIVQGPRLAVIMINLLFLLNIIRVLIVKLRRSESTEVQKVRKAVRAAIVLLPLLGITNALNMTEAPLDDSVWKFALWSYGTHFLRSFQGFFIALIYCFMNGEVRLVLAKHYENFIVLRANNRRQRNSMQNFSARRNRNYRTQHDQADATSYDLVVSMEFNIPRRPNLYTISTRLAILPFRGLQSSLLFLDNMNQRNRPPWIPMRTFRWHRGRTTNDSPDIEMGLRTSQGGDSNRQNSPIWIPMRTLRWHRDPIPTTNAIIETEIEPGTSRENQQNNETRVEYADCGASGNECQGVTLTVTNLNDDEQISRKY